MRVKIIIITVLFFVICLPAISQQDDGESTPEPVPGIIIVTEVEVTEEPVPAIIIEEETTAEAVEAEKASAEGAVSAEVDETSVDTTEETAESEEEGNAPEIGVVTFILFGILGVMAAGLGLIGREQQYGNEETT